MPAVELQRFIPNEQPTFASLWWDNAKTSAAYGGVATGVIPAVAAGILGGTALCIMSLCAGFPAKTCGAVGGAIGAIPGALIGLAFSVPAAFVAKGTRKFLPLAEINNMINALPAVLDDTDKENIIRKILGKYNSNWSYTSYESYFLNSTLKSKEIALEDKWQHLMAYLNDKSSNGANKNNGKRLFTTILNVFNEKIQNPALQLRNAILTEKLSIIDELLDRHPEFIHNAIMSDLNILQYAALNNKVNVLKHLMANPILNKLSKNIIHHGEWEGNNALGIACKLKHTGSILALKGRESSIRVNNLQQHAIHIAATMNDIPTIKALASPENINLRDGKAYTPLMSASVVGANTVIKTLLEEKAEINATIIAEDGQEKNALALAVDAKMESTADLLAAKGARDIKTDRMRAELVKVIEILSYPEWKKQGKGFFGTHVPGRISELKKYIENAENLFTLNRAQFREHVYNLHRRAAYHSDYATNTLQSKLYKLVHNLGENKDEDFAVFGALNNQRLGQLNPRFIV